MNKVKSVEPSPYRITVLIRKDTRELAFSLLMCAQRKDLVKTKQPSTIQEERPPQKLTMPNLDRGLSSLQIYEKINFCHLGHTICGTLLRQPKQTKTPLLMVLKNL